MPAWVADLSTCFRQTVLLPIREASNGGAVMAAGDSAGAEARRQRALANAHRREADQAEEAASRYGIAEVTERRIAAMLARLDGVGGYHLVPDRRWPGSARAQVDLIVVGPGGLFIVDTKAWAEVTIEDGRIFRGQADVTDDLSNLADLRSTTEGIMAEVGLAPGEVRALVVLAGRRGIDQWVGPVRIVGEHDALHCIGGHGNRLTPDQVETVRLHVLETFPEVGESAPVNAVVDEPVLPAPPDPPTPDSSSDPLLDDADVRAALMGIVLAAPIEEWMSFLHPDQAKLARRSFNGPARIRGPVGTGKTVVGLHRAAHLARTHGGKVLVTTFVRTLPLVLHNLMERMAPEVADRIEFVGVHGFARRFLAERGVEVKLDQDAADAAFGTAWDQVPADSPLKSSSAQSEYWREEVVDVIKGRGITTWEAYAELDRHGRRRALGVNQRRAVWDLYSAYDAELRQRGVHDWADIILRAEQELRRQPLDEPYIAVIVDEAQDLSCMMIRLLHALVGDEPDGFTLIGDGQQSIYPGGYTLAEAGVNIAGRGVVLDVNYRNTAQILDFASRMVADDEFADIEGAIARGDAARAVARTGPEPKEERFQHPADRDHQLVARVKTVLREVGTGPGDIGVLAMTHAGVNRAADALRHAGFEVVMLEHYDGREVDAVKVGTVKRAKGLEFKQVMLPDVQSRQFGDADPPEDEVERERWDRDRRELYVAMTRARDGLWVGVV